MKITSGCYYCPSTLPTIVICTIGKQVSSLCRACILEALKGIEEPGDYPSIIEDRDVDLDTLKKAGNVP